MVEAMRVDRAPSGSGNRTRKVGLRQRAQGLRHSAANEPNSERPGEGSLRSQGKMALQQVDLPQVRGVREGRRERATVGWLGATAAFARSGFMEKTGQSDS